MMINGDRIFIFSGTIPLTAPLMHLSEITKQIDFLPAKQKEVICVSQIQIDYRLLVFTCKIADCKCTIYMFCKLFNLITILLKFLFPTNDSVHMKSGT